MQGMDLGLSDKACVVTGASRGIGAAVARLLEDEGARVLGVSRSQGFQADVTDPGAAERIVAECEARFGGIDVLVNNAGTSEIKPLDELEDADWQAQWELNVMASMHLMQVACPKMAERGGGRVVNVSSSSGKRPSQTNAAYSVAKAAQLSLSRAYADAWAGRGVLVNAVTPGIVASQLWMADGGMADQIAAAQRPDPRAGGGREGGRPARGPLRERGGDRGRGGHAVLEAGVQRGRGRVVGRRRRRARDHLTRGLTSPG